MAKYQVLAECWISQVPIRFTEKDIGTIFETPNPLRPNKYLQRLDPPAPEEIPEAPPAPAKKATAKRKAPAKRKAK